MKRLAALLISLLMFFSGLFGCKSLANTSWELTAWSVSAHNPQDYTFTLAFDTKTFSGQSAVNSYGGQYTAFKDGRLIISGIYSTEMAGTPEAMATETVYFELLNSAKRYKLVEDTLTLLDANGNELLIFTRSPQT